MYTVQDFSHIRATPSPNFSNMPDLDMDSLTKVLEGLVRTGVQRSQQGDGPASAALALDIILPM